MKFLIIFGGLWLLTSPALAQEPSWLTPIVGHGYGVQVKEGRTGDDELRMIKDSGLHYVRFVIPWYEVEKRENDFVWGYFDLFVKRLKEHGLGAVIVLGGGHPDYTGVMKAPKGNIDKTDKYLLAPATPAARAGFSRFAAKAARRFAGYDIIWELWNEPDQDRFWAPRAKVEDYIAVADTACRAMREADPTARIIGPGMADTPGRWGTLRPGFLGAVLESPVSACLDAVSVHPYRDGEKPPETVGEAYRKLRAFIKAYTPKGQKIPPVLATEWGFTLTDTNPEEQAAFLLRSLLLNTLHEIPVSIWYEWRDARPGDNDPEAHFGLLTLKRKPKPSYDALKSFLPPLVGAQLEKRIAVGDKENDYVLHFRHSDDRHHLVGWTLGGEKPLSYSCGKNGRKQSTMINNLPVRIDCGKDKPIVIEE